MISDSAQMLNDFELNLKTTLRGDLHGADRGCLIEHSRALYSMSSFNYFIDHLDEI